MSTESPNTTELPENLTRERQKLRQLHQATQPQFEINYRGHALRREHLDETQSGCYRIVDQDGRFVDTIEPSDFYHADDFVRYCDLVIQHGRERAQDWVDTELTWNPDEARYRDGHGADELDEHIITNRSTSAKKKHRPAGPHTDEPACDAPLHNGQWVRKSSRHTVFQDVCQNPECFGGDGE